VSDDRQYRTYRIPFRPEYLLLGYDKVPADRPTREDVPAHRFHISEAAMALVRAQDVEGESRSGGFCDLRVEFDATKSGGVAVMVLRRIYDR
jgi:hypothetical protein